MLALKGRGVNLNCFIEKMKTGTGMDKRYNTGNPRPSNSMKDLNDNALAYDDFLNSESDTFIDRFGNAQDTIIGATKKMAAATDAVIDEARQNLIPLSRQYMTLAAAQAMAARYRARFSAPVFLY